MDLLEKRVLLTGGTSGIGREAVLLMAKRGYKIAFTGRDSNRGIAVENLGGNRVKFIKTDSTKIDEVKQSIRIAHDFLGGFDVLVNNAGIHKGRKDIEEMSEDDLDAIINVNIKSQINYIKEILPFLKSQKSGTVVNVNSINSIRGVYKRPDYTISKGAMLSLTRQIALDYAKFNIRVNAAIFGLIITPFAVSDIESINAHEYTKRVNKIPLKRAGSAYEAAKVIFFLASDESSFLTGASIVADGGVSSSVYV